MILILVSLTACSGNDSQDSADADDTAPTGDTQRTLDNCGTDIDGTAPAFLSSYFLCVSAAADDSDLTIHTVDLPPHLTNYYGEGDPNYAPFDTSRGSEYHANPNTLSPQDLVLQIPVAPNPRGITIDASLVDGVTGTSDDEYPIGPAGVALDGVEIFNPNTPAGADRGIEQEKYTFDDYDAHPADTGEYHYHTSSPGPLEALQEKGLVTSTTPGSAEIELYGVMCDGTVVLGCTELDGTAPASGGFDAQFGHVHDLTDEDGTVILSNRYHVHICPGTYATYTPEIAYYDSCSAMAAH
jgi:hypothetical protein